MRRNRDMENGVEKKKKLTRLRERAGEAKKSLVGRGLDISMSMTPMAIWGDFCLVMEWLFLRRRN